MKTAFRLAGALCLLLLLLFLLLRPFITAKSCEKEVGRLEQQLQQFIQFHVENEISYANRRFDFPCEYKKIYFFDNKKTFPYLKAVVPEDMSYAEESPANGFFSDGESFTSHFTVQDLQFGQVGYLCIEAGEEPFFELHLVKGNPYTLDAVANSCTVSPLVLDIARRIGEDATDEEVAERVEQIANNIHTMEDVEISRNFVYDEIRNVSIVRLSINSTKNIDYYEYIPKCFAEDADEIIIAGNNSNVQVIESDPLLMWDFSFSKYNTSTDVAYESIKKLEDYCKSLFEGIGIARDPETGELIATNPIKGGTTVVKFKIEIA